MSEKDTGGVCMRILRPKIKWLMYVHHLKLLAQTNEIWMERIYEHVTTRRLHFWIEELVWGLRVQSHFLIATFRTVFMQEYEILVSIFQAKSRLEYLGISRRIIWKENPALNYIDRNWTEMVKNVDHCQAIMKRR